MDEFGMAILVTKVLPYKYGKNDSFLSFFVTPIFPVKRNNG